ncbi:hypothetical protein ACQP1O_16940 [Nocardia sp. CA-151230]|uniref:hypothetical protein n=1 Tax=Nocardia sp. CA-151230 TaxID=3239982 RepID=UPI003D8A29FB
MASAGKPMLAACPTNNCARGVRTSPAGDDRQVRVSISTLIREVATTRRVGYAINHGESEPGVLAMGIAYTLPEADIVAGRSVAGPDSVLNES